MHTKLHIKEKGKKFKTIQCTLQMVIEQTLIYIDFKCLMIFLGHEFE